MNPEEFEKIYPRHPVEDDSEGGKLFRQFEDKEIEKMKKLLSENKEENPDNAKLD